MLVLKLLNLLCAISLLAACATNSSVSHCRSGEQRVVIDSLYFGTAAPEGQVKPDDWQWFLVKVITPRFPKGITSWVAAGQWRSGAGRIEKERSYVLQIVHPDSPQTDEDIREIVSIYKKRFHQEAVLRVRSPACISF